MKRLLPKNAWLMWAIATTFVLFQFTLQMSSGVMAKPWMHDFHLNRLGLSYLSSCFYYSYLVLQIPAGLLFDRYGSRRVLIFAASTLATGCFILAIAPNYELALIGRAIMGVGSTFAFIGMLCLVADWFPAKKFTFFVSISESLAMIVTAFGIILFAFIVSHSNWRITMLGSGILALGLVILVYLFVFDSDAKQQSASKSKTDIHKQVIEVFRNRQIWLAGSYSFCAFALLTIFASLWGVPFLIASFGVNLHNAATAVSMVLIGIAIGGPTLGILSNKLRKRLPILRYSMLLAALDFIVLICMHKESFLLISPLILFSGILCASYIIAFAYAKEVTRKEVRGTAMAATNFITMISAPFLQPAIGLLLHTHLFGYSHSLNTDYRVALMIMPILFIIAFLLTFKMRETHCMSTDD